MPLNEDSHNQIPGINSVFTLVTIVALTSSNPNIHPVIYVRKLQKRNTQISANGTNLSECIRNSKFEKFASDTQCTIQLKWKPLSRAMVNWIGPKMWNKSDINLPFATNNLKACSTKLRWVLQTAILKFIDHFYSSLGIVIVEWQMEIKLIFFYSMSVCLFDCNYICIREKKNFFITSLCSRDPIHKLENLSLFILRLNSGSGLGHWMR